MGATHAVNPQQSQRHRLKNQKRVGVTLFDCPGFASRVAAKHHAEKAAATIGEADVYQRADGTWAPVVRLVLGRWWMLEHVNFCRCVGWPDAYNLPAPGLAKPPAGMTFTPRTEA